jgi:flagellar motor switch protein FliN
MTRPDARCGKWRSGVSAGKKRGHTRQGAVDITVVGTTSMPIHQVLRLGRGAIIELDAMEEDAVSILANNLPVAKGTVGRERQPHCRQRGRIASPASRYPVNGRP